MSLLKFLGVVGSLLFVLTLAAPAICARLNRLMLEFSVIKTQAAARRVALLKAVQQRVSPGPTFSLQPNRVFLGCLSIGLLVCAQLHIGDDPGPAALWSIPVFYLPAWVVTNFGKRWADP